MAISVKLRNRNGTLPVKVQHADDNHTDERMVFIDIETSPTTVYTWGLHGVDIPVGSIINPGRTICVTTKFAGKPAKCVDIRTPGMLESVWHDLDAADVVVHYNGKSFDIPTLNGEFMKAGMPPPSPFVQLDLYRDVVCKAKFVSRKLQFVSNEFGIGSKLEHAGMQMWIDCMHMDESAWKIMRKYNIQDVILLEKLYAKLKPWISSVPSGGDGCQHLHVQKRGMYRTRATTYQRLYCSDCGAWIRGSKGVSRAKFTRIPTSR